MLFKKASDLRWSDVTDEKLYMNRREFMRKSGFVAGSSIAATSLPGMALGCAAETDEMQQAFETSNPPDELTPWEAVTGYNNYYEFGTGKEDPARNAHTLETSPWEIKVEGEVEEERTWSFEELVDGFEVEQRIYRMRCVEGWSMVIPWNGFPLAELMTRMKPTSKAQYIEFTTLADRSQMPGLSRPVLDWPYVEGLRMDEAMNPLTLMVTGVYDKTLPNQNGAPIRLIVPWKYGFKGAKSIVKIRLTEKQPRTTWAATIPNEYGFYANVNPKVDHPRWSQATERRIGEFFRRDTLMFNGYEEEVASLYSGMDLAKYY